MTIDNRLIIHNLKEVVLFLNEIDDSTRTRIIVMNIVQKVNNVITALELRAEMEKY